MKLDGSAYTDWRVNGADPHKGLRLERAGDPGHWLWVQPRLIAATESHARHPGAASPGGEPVAQSGQAPSRASNARATDPDTSHLAAASVTEQARRDIHARVLAILAEGPASDFDLAARTERLATSVGVRRKELCRMGLVRELDRNGISASGSPCIRWCLTEAGWAAA